MRDERSFAAGEGRAAASLAHKPTAHADDPTSFGLPAWVSSPHTMLGARHRLRRSTAIAEVLKSGRRAVAPGLKVAALVEGREEPESRPIPASEAARRRGNCLPREAPQADGAKAAVVATKGFPTAVSRHRALRRVREVLRKELETLPPGRYVVVVDPRVEGYGAEDLRKHVSLCLRKAIGARGERAR